MKQVGNGENASDPKRPKLLGGLPDDQQHQEDRNKENKSAGSAKSVTAKSPSPSPMPASAAAAASPAPPPAADPFRCEPCDIGFAHLSNFLAHKKYYCRGAALKEQPADPAEKSAAVKMEVNGAAAAAAGEKSN